LRLFEGDIQKSAANVPPLGLCCISAIRLFKNLEFFHCHKVLKKLGLGNAGRADCFYKPSFTFRSVSITASGDNPAGARRQFHKGPRKLASYLPSCEGTEYGSLVPGGTRGA